MCRFLLLAGLLCGPSAFSQQPDEAARIQPRVLWTVETKSDSKGSAAAADIDGDGKLEIVFGTYFNDRHVYAVSAADGRIKWKFRSDRGPLDASVAIADLDADGKLDVLAADSSSGNLFCLDSKGQEKWRLKLPNSTDSPPSIADIDGDGKLDIAAGSMWMGDGQGHISVYRGDNRKRLWQNKVPGCVQSAACLVNLNDDKSLDVVVTSWRGDRGVHAFDGKDGKLLWRFKTAGTDRSMGMYHGPSVAGQGAGRRILFATCDGDVYALDAAGKKIWHHAMAGEYLFAPTTVADIDGDGKDELIVGGRQHLYVLRVSDGKLIWKHQVRSFIGRGAVVADVTGDGRLDVIFCEGSRLHVLNGKGRRLCSFDASDEKQRAGGRISSAPIVADFDADGALDVFFVIGRGNYGRDGKLQKQNWGRGYAVRLGGKGPGWTTFRGSLQRRGQPATASRLP